MLLVKSWRHNILENKWRCKKCCLTLGWDTIGWDNISPDVQILGIDLSPVGECRFLMFYNAHQSRTELFKELDKTVHSTFLCHGIAMWLCVHWLWCFYMYIPCTHFHKKSKCFVYYISVWEINKLSLCILFLLPSKVLSFYILYYMYIPTCTSRGFQDCDIFACIPWSL